MKEIEELQRAIDSTKSSKNELSRFTASEAAPKISTASRRPVTDVVDM
jgi:hypothetical protein